MAAGTCRSRPRVSRLSRWFRCRVPRGSVSGSARSRRDLHCLDGGGPGCQRTPPRPQPDDAHGEEQRLNTTHLLHAGDDGGNYICLQDSPRLELCIRIRYAIIGDDRDGYGSYRVTTKAYDYSLRVAPLCLTITGIHLEIPMRHHLISTSVPRNSSRRA